MRRRQGRDNAITLGFSNRLLIFLMSAHIAAEDQGRKWSKINIDLSGITVGLSSKLLIFLISALAEDQGRNGQT